MPLGFNARPMTAPYRGYVAIYEAVDGKFMITLQGTHDVVTAVADTAAAVQKEFETMVDDYLSTKDEVGK